MAQTEVESKGSYGGFEKFLYLFLIPVVFTSILTFVLLSMFNYDVMNSILTVANKIPLIEKVVPEPEVESEGVIGEEGLAQSEYSQSDEELISQIQELKQQVNSSQALVATKEQEIEELREEVAALTEQLEGKTQTEEEYEEQIKQLASVYADMSPSKSAAILEQLTLEELVLVLGQMSSDDQVRVLEKMNPRIAAEASIQLKDQIPVRDQEIAALQARLNLQSEEGTQTEAFSIEQLSQTYAAMLPANAANVLMEIYRSVPNQVIQILRNMDVNSRSLILNEMAEISEETTALITKDL